MAGELDELFSRLKSQSSTDQASHTQSTTSSLWTQPPIQSHQPPSVSSPLFSPPIHTPNPVHSSNIISPAGTPAATSDQNKTNNLLNLLRSSSQASQSSASAGPMATLQNVGRSSSGTFETSAIRNGTKPQSSPLFAQDLAASLQRSRPADLPPARTAIAGAEKSEAPASATQQYLLDLLRKPSAAPSAVSTDASSKPADVKQSIEPSVEKLADSLADTSLQAKEPERAQREPTPVRQFGSPATSTTPFETPQPTKPMFNYLNPFEQLHSSSPLNRSPKPDATQAEPKKIEILKHDRDVSTSNTAPAAKSRKIDGGPGSPSPVRPEAEPGQSVSEALEDVGEKVDKQVEQALKKADAQQQSTATTAKQDSTSSPTKIKKEPKADDGIESSWESAEDEEAEQAGEEFQLEVLNFPMRAFVSISIKRLPEPLAVRQEGLNFIARLKKDFDQIDRNLVTASQTHIVYAPVPTKKVQHPGLRIIQQESGKHKHVFTSTPERIFNVQISNSSHDVETVLGTGVNGSIFWTSLSKSRGELFVDDDVDAQGFIMPPVATQEEQTSGSPVKTRAKVSSRHPEIFAMSRGKQIHIIAPDAVKDKKYYNSKARMVNTEKFLADHSLLISTGKAGKDFCFSEDDTVIVSLDKSGKFKFWDIQALTRATDITEERHHPVELREPLWSRSAAASGSKPDEKPSVSSIMFLDKERPTLKGVALRYMLIGFKQNHILQLWDLGLGKAVQEVRLPHEKDSDGICSITYQPRNGIIAVGHPTRNSIFFIHLSAPMYRLPNMDQAKYIGLLAREDPSIPRPSSTAIMSGIRELSFAKIGELRSVDLLRTPVEPSVDPEDPNAPLPDPKDVTLFELYAMHSKGVVNISIKRPDLGWDSDSKPVKPVDAVEAQYIEVAALSFAEPPTAPSEHSSVADTPSKQPKSAGNKKQEAAKAQAASTPKKETADDHPKPTSAPHLLKAHGQQKEDQPRTAEQGSMQVPEAPKPSQTGSTNPPLMTAESYAMTARETHSPHRGPAAPANGSKQPTPRSDTVSAPRVSSDGDLQNMLNKQFDALYDRIDGDKRVVDAAASARQDAMLRLVSSTLTENVEKSLNRIVSSSIEDKVIPALSSAVLPAIQKKLADTLPQMLNTNVAREVKAVVPQAFQQALKDASVQRSVSDQISSKVQQQVSQMLQQAMPNIATQAAQKMVADLDARMKQQFKEFEKQRVQDNNKIAELTKLVSDMAATVNIMSESQVKFQDEMMKLQQIPQNAPVEAARDQTDGAAAPAPKEMSAEELEVVKITDLLTKGEYDRATIEWLQSPRQGALFDLIFVRVNPHYLERVTPLIALSVSAAITASFGSFVEQRLEWLSVVLDNINTNDEEIRDVAGKIMDVLSQRLQGAYMQVGEERPGEGELLKKIGILHRRVAEVKKMAG